MTSQKENGGKLKRYSKLSGKLRTKQTPGSISIAVSGLCGAISFRATLKKVLSTVGIED